MLSAVVAPLAFAPAPVFQAPAQMARSSVRMGAESMEGIGPESGGKIFDPLNMVRRSTPQPRQMVAARAGASAHGLCAAACVCQSGPFMSIRTSPPPHTVRCASG
jgi:hypothetical protein